MLNYEQFVCLLCSTLLERNERKSDTEEFVTLEEFEITRLRLVIYKFFSCCSNITRGLSAYKP